MSNRILYIGYLLMFFMLGGCSQDDDVLSIVDLGSVSGCDAAKQTCSIAREGVSLSLRLGPDVQPLEPFPLQLEIDGVSVQEQSVSIDFRMVGMDMGINRYRLEAADNGQWRTTATLPVCGTNRMDWNALVEFTAEGQHYLLRFPFQVVTNRSGGA